MPSRKSCKKTGVAKQEKGIFLVVYFVVETVCKLFGVSATTYDRILGSYLQRQEAYTSVNGGNTRPKMTRLPQPKAK
jgi:hypothetical protein